MDDWELENPPTTFNIADLKELARDPEALVNRLDMLFTHGSLSQRTREIIKEAITPLIYYDYRDDRVRLAMYLILISPDYNVMK